MIKQIEKYWEKLFADPICVDTAKGQTFILPQRTNNILERFFRDLKRGNRKKSGSVRLSKSLKAMIADTPLVKNLENENYLNIILNGCSSLEERFSQIDNKVVLEELKKSQLNPDKLPKGMKKIIKMKELPQKINEAFINIAN